MIRESRVLISFKSNNTSVRGRNDFITTNVTLWNCRSRKYIGNLCESSVSKISHLTRTWSAAKAV